MGPAIASLSQIRAVVIRQTMATGLIALVAGITYLLYFVISFIPLIGWIIAVPIFAFGVGAMYAIARRAIIGEQATISEVTGRIQDRWISLLGAYGLIFVLWIIAFILLLLAMLVILLIGVLAVGDVEANPLAGGVLVVGTMLLMIGLYFVVAMVAQFFFPAIMVTNATAIEAVTIAFDLLRSNPVSVTGFTALRILLEYGFIVLAIGLVAVVTQVDFFETGWAGAMAGDGLLELGFSVLALVQFLVLVSILVAGVVVGQALRILYTTIYLTIRLDSKMDN